MKITRFLAAAVIVLALAGCGGDTFKPLADWGGDLKAAKEQAKTAGKPLAILYSAPWSGVAREFETKVLRDAKVKAELKRFVRVRLNLDDQDKKGKKDEDGEKKNEYGVKWVPSLVLVSPLGEVKKLEKGGYPAGYLAKELAKLGEWKGLEEEGWESHRAAAEKKAASSGKPLAVLYSAAWTEDAVEYEKKGLAGAHKVLEARYTLLRLNFAANRKEAEALKLKAAPTLVLPGSGGKKLVVTGKHSAEILASFVEGLAGYQKVPGWNSDYDATRQKALRDSRPLAVVLDKAADWNSHHFVREVMGAGEIAALLGNFEKVRLEYDPEWKLAKEHDVQPADVPCVLIFSKTDGKFVDKHTYKESVTQILERVRTEGGKAPMKAKSGA